MNRLIPLGTRAPLAWLILLASTAGASGADPPPVGQGVPEKPIPKAPGDPEANRVRVRDESGRIVVARVYGGEDSGMVVLPDGQLGWPQGMAFTDDPFQPDPADDLAERLARGPYHDFQFLKTEHFLVFFRSTEPFAADSARLLESLYTGLLEKLSVKGVRVHEAEFPLVAVIFRTEEDFRAHRQVDPDVQAYYHVVSNRIFFYQTSARDEEAPDVAARRKPQTVAHEGTHQILQNIGVHPRMAPWPAWLVEGLAEYFAPTTLTRSREWDGANRVNPFHMATLRDLQDPLSAQLKARGVARTRFGPSAGAPWIESLVTRETLSPTDYALSWALTYYLANNRLDDFVAYLNAMGEVSPSAKLRPDDHLARFRETFGADLAGLNKALNRYLARLKNYETLPFFAVTFEQPIGGGLVRRGAMVSQSPAMIRQWIDLTIIPDGGPPSWHALPFSTRTRAYAAAQMWLNGR